MIEPLALAVLVFVPMLLETGRSHRNARALLARGAVEAHDALFPVMQVAYPACFVAMIVEGWMRPAAPGLAAIAGGAVFVLAKALKYWAIASLGHFWSFRVLVLPGAPLVTTGPYRWLRHPNYVGVAGEIVGIALLAWAPVTGVIGFALFGALLLARIRVEERALDISRR
jgi:methyltransferase